MGFQPYSSIVGASLHGPAGEGRIDTMSQTSVDYLDTLRRSKLIDEQSLAAVVEHVEQETGIRPADPEKVAARLLQDGTITPWQNDQLREGRYHGFFLGKYKLLDHLGSGGMGDVFLAEHGRLERQVAVKVLPPALIENEQLLKRFYQEARATALLDHPNIVKAFDIDQEGDVHYLVMEYVRGHDLQQKVQRDGWLEPAEIARYLMQAAGALAHAHERKMIHRDIKPSNLLVNDEGKLKLLDMGVARILEEGDEESLTLAGHEEVLGTVDYLAPEQLVDPHHVDGRADLYSLGCTMFFLLVGKAPFAEGTMAQRLMAHQVKDPPDVLAERPDVPEDLVQICYKLMAKSPEERFASASELRNTFKEWLKVSQEGLLRDSALELELPPKTAKDTESSFNTETLLNQLVAQNVLTEYQQRALSEQSHCPLVVGNYQIRDRVEEGRLAGMYRGIHSRFHFPTCMRIVEAAADADQNEQLARFQREARISIQVNHPNVVRTYDVGRSGELYFVCYEDLTGNSMLQWLASPPEHTVNEICRAARDAALGLAHLHDQQIVHRDVNPNNLWVTPEGKVKILDFGLARDALHFLDEPGLEKGGDDDFLGTMDYLAPEQAVNSESATALSDVYSLGCTLYQLLTGEVPFPEKSSTKKMLHHATAEPPVPSRKNPQVPAELDELVVRMMAKKPVDRPQGAFIVASLLELFL